MRSTPAKPYDRHASGAVGPNAPTPVARAPGMAISSAKKFLHSLQRLMQIGFARRIGQPHKTFSVGSEALPEDQRHMGLVKQLAGEVTRRPTGVRDIGEGIEGPAWYPAAHAFDGVQSLDHEIAALLEAQRKPSISSIGPVMAASPAIWVATEVQE